MLAAPQSPNPAITAIYPSSPVTLATGVVSAATVPPGVVYTVSSPSILPKHTSTTSVTPTTLPAPERPSHGPAHAELDRQTDKLPLSLTDRHTKVGSSSTAPPSGATLPLQPASPAQPSLAGRHSYLSELKIYSGFFQQLFGYFLTFLYIYLKKSCSCIFFSSCHYQTSPGPH